MKLQPRYSIKEYHPGHFHVLAPDGHPIYDDSTNGDDALIILSFQRELLGTWTQIPAEQRLHDLAREYHERTEHFDRTHCQFKNERGIAIPITTEERGNCNTHATWLKTELEKEAAHLGFSKEQWRKAIANANNF